MTFKAFQLLILISYTGIIASYFAHWSAGNIPEQYSSIIHVSENAFVNRAPNTQLNLDPFSYIIVRGDSGAILAENSSITLVDKSTIQLIEKCKFEIGRFSGVILQNGSAILCYKKAMTIFEQSEIRMAPESVFGLKGGAIGISSQSKFDLSIFSRIQISAGKIEFSQTNVTLKYNSTFFCNGTGDTSVSKANFFLAENSKLEFATNSMSVIADNSEIRLAPKSHFSIVNARKFWCKNCTIKLKPNSQFHLMSNSYLILKNSLLSLSKNSLKMIIFGKLQLENVKCDVNENVVIDDYQNLHINYTVKSPWLKCQSFI